MVIYQVSKETINTPRSQLGHCISQWPMFSPAPELCLPAHLPLPPAVSHPRGEEGRKRELGQAFRCHVTLPSRSPCTSVTPPEQTMTNNSFFLPSLFLSLLDNCISCSLEMHSFKLVLQTIFCELCMNVIWMCFRARWAAVVSVTVMGGGNGAMPHRRKAFTLACQREADSSTEVRRAGFSMVAKHYSVTGSNPVMCVNSYHRCVKFLD